MVLQILSVKHFFYIACGIALKLVLGLQIWQCLVLVCLGYLGTGGLRPTYIFLKTLPRDIRYFWVLIKVVKGIGNYDKTNATIPELFRQVVSKYRNKTAILFEDQKWTFHDLNTYSNKVANMLLKNGFKSGDTIALFMTNCPEYVGILIGASTIGVKVALINYNLRNKGLYHCITIADCSGIIYENTLEEAIDNIHEQFDNELQKKCYCCSGNPNTSFGQSFDTEVEEQSDEPVALLKDRSIRDVVCYIYTSGTTGLPKAVPIKHQRFLNMVVLFEYSAPLSTDDILYDALPLYHSNGGVLTMGQCFVRGLTVALRRKFSASQFFKDCIKYRCTAFSYIGELCRYILLQPPAETDTQHSIVKCFGNGLRPDIWRQFQKRFAIPKIVEFYGATEGTFAHVNLVGKVGAIGYYSFFVRPLLKIYFIKIDPTTGEIVRDTNGFCVEVLPGEKGEMVRAINQKDPANRFDGYKDATATSKKILRDVFKKGDNFFRTGDIAKIDEEGYIYFCDRAGDTFRWKGENVSTTEVENTISSLIDQKDVIVYGVIVPNTEGRAGMAAIVGTTESVNVTVLGDQLKGTLPSYAIPLFIRLIDSSHITGTFKFQKVEYRKEGFNIESVSDELFVFHPIEKKYVPLTKEMYENVTNGRVRF